MLIRQRPGAILLLFTAEARDLLLAHGRVFDVQVLQHNCNGIFSILSALLIRSFSILLNLWQHSWNLQTYHWKCAYRSDVIQAELHEYG